MMASTDQPEIDELVRELAAEVMQVYRWLAEQAGLNQTDLLSLYFLKRANGTATPTSLAEHLGLTTGATAILLNRLEKRGYITRTRHPTDRRGVLISLGPEANNNELKQLRQRLFQLNADVISELSTDEAEVVRAFITRIAANTRMTLDLMRTEAAERPDTIAGK